MMMITDFYGIQSIEKQHGRILSNVLLTNYCHLYSPRSSKEPQLKTYFPTAEVVQL